MLCGVAFQRLLLIVMAPKPKSPRLRKSSSIPFIFFSISILPGIYTFPPPSFLIVNPTSSVPHSCEMTTLNSETLNPSSVFFFYLHFKFWNLALAFIFMHFFSIVAGIKWESIAKKPRMMSTDAAMADAFSSYAEYLNKLVYSLSLSLGKLLYSIYTRERLHWMLCCVKM